MRVTESEVASDASCLGGDEVRVLAHRDTVGGLSSARQAETEPLRGDKRQLRSWVRSKCNNGWMPRPALHSSLHSSLHLSGGESFAWQRGSVDEGPGVLGPSHPADAANERPCGC